MKKWIHYIGGKRMNTASDLFIRFSGLYSLALPMVKLSGIGSLLVGAPKQNRWQRQIGLTAAAASDIIGDGSARGPDGFRRRRLSADGV